MKFIQSILSHASAQWRTGIYAITARFAGRQCAQLVWAGAAALGGAGSASAQVVSVSPSVFNLNVATGGSVQGLVSPAPGAGTGDRQAAAAVCSALAPGALAGVSLANPCAAGATFATVNVGFAANTGVPYVFGSTFTPAQIGILMTSLVAAGQPPGSRRAFLVTQFNASPIPPSSATRFVTLQINLIEPVTNVLTSAGTGFSDVALSGASVVSLRYTVSGTDSPGIGLFCGALNGPYPVDGVSSSNPCAAVLGGAGSAAGYSNAQPGERLTVPSGVAAQALAQARQSGNGVFYFVRQFASGRYAVSKLRLNGHAANTPLVFTDIRLGFKDGSGLQNLGFFKRGQVMPATTALLRYQGAGILRARWEIVTPGDESPSALDLSAQATLSPTGRATQRRYRVLERVNVYLPATGQAVIAGPSARFLPNDQYGQYQLLLRLEATESVSGTPGGAAPFALPVLRYFIGESAMAFAAKTAPATIDLLSPEPHTVLATEGTLAFAWQETVNVGLYRLELEANGKPVYSARVRASAPAFADLASTRAKQYVLPPFVVSSLVGKAVRWRVVALSSDGQFAGQSEWRELLNAP